MTFNENNVNRESDGRFGEKNGSPADVTLTARLTPDGGFVLASEEELAARSPEQVFLDDIRSIGFARAEDIALRDEVMKDRAKGRSHLYDHHYTDIWNGNAVNIFGEQDGWSKELIEQKLANTDEMLYALQNGKTRARDISENWEKQSDGIAWAKAVKTELTDALASEGRSLFVNAAAARERYQDFEGGRNGR